MKQRYRTYRASIEANSKERALNNLSMDYPSRPWPKPKIAEIQEGLKKAIDGPMLTQKDLPMLSSSIDLCWLRDGCPSIFVDNVALLDMLLSCNIDIRYEEVYLPIFESESPDRPSSMVATGRSPFLVSEGSVSFAIPAGGRIRPFCVGRIPGMYGDWAYLLSIRLGWAAVMHSLSTGNADFQKHLNGGCFRDDDISSEESTELINCWRLFAAILLYIKAFPHLIENGPPSETTPLERRSILKGSSRTVTISLSPEARNAPSPHLRRFHFRTLRDKRFKRCPDGSPRVITVRQSIIGNITNAKTVKEPKGFTVKALKRVDK